MHNPLVHALSGSDDVAMATTQISPRTHRLVFIEVAAAAGIVLFVDSLLRTASLVLLAGVSLVLHRRRPSSLGFVRVRLRGILLPIAAIVVAWTLVQIGVILPILNHLLGTTQDLSQFEDLRGDETGLAVFLLLTWTIAAVGEEFAYRGYVLTRTLETVSSCRWKVIIATGVAAVLFGLAHTDQGLIGVIVTTLDGALFGVLRYRFATTWASVLAHGMSNTLGLVTFYLIGPVYGLWRATDLVGVPDSSASRSARRARPRIICPAITKSAGTTTS
jgi:membrane protease YdiL (CAAX protease family)